MMETKTENRELTHMNLNINKIKMCSDILECMMAEEIRHVIHAYDHLKTQTMHVMNG